MRGGRVALVAVLAVPWCLMIYKLMRMHDQPRDAAGQHSQQHIGVDDRGAAAPHARAPAAALLTDVGVAKISHDGARERNAHGEGAPGRTGGDGDGSDGGQGKGKGARMHARADHWMEDSAVGADASGMYRCGRYAWHSTARVSVSPAVGYCIYRLTGRATHTHSAATGWCAQAGVHARAALCGPSH